MSETQAVQEVAEEIVQHSGALGKVGLLAGGLIVGASSGYYVAKRRLEKKYADLADTEIESVKAAYASKVRESASTRTAEDVIVEEGYVPPPIPNAELKEAFQDQHHDHQEDGWRRLGEKPEEEITANVFGDEDVWEQEEEQAMRDAGMDPYVLSRAEWDEETGYARERYTYFEGDDVLADEHDNPADDIELLVGLPNLEKFGHGSGDPNVVFIRNLDLQMEFEVVKSEGKFSEQSRGFVRPDPPSTDPRKRRNRGPH